MKPAGEKLAVELDGLKVSSPKIPVVHNVHAQTESDPEVIKSLLVEQIYSPVRWVSCVQAMIESGVDTTIECGPGKVLSGLNKRIHKPMSCLAIEQGDALLSAIETVSQ